MSEPPRLAARTLEPLCRYVDFHRRLSLAVSELEHRLAALQQERWRTEPYPLTGERRNTLLVIGERGVFVISATYAPGHFDDVITVSRLARKIQMLLLGYPGRVQAAICFPFSSARPRIWYRADERGEWLGPAGSREAGEELAVAGGSAEVALQLDVAARLCERCAEAGRTCPSCVQRRRSA